MGPEPHHRTYLGDALASVRAQSRPPDHVLLVDDMAGLSIGALGDLNELWGSGWTIYHPPWRLGVPGAFNAGVALCKADFVLMMGADDILYPRCLERVEERIIELGLERSYNGYHYLPIRYLDTGELQDVPCNCAVVGKGMWAKSGGFPPESGVGACDAALISILMVNREAGELLAVPSPEPLYGYRRHATTDTSTRSPAWQGPILATRDLLTREWRPPAWGRSIP